MTVPTQSARIPGNTDTKLPTELVNPSLGEPLAPADALAVHETVARVYLAEDSRDYDALRALFTDDAVHEHSLYGRVEGAEAIVAFVRENVAFGFDGVRHHAFNVVTRRTGPDGAEAVSYVTPLKLFPQASEADGDLPRILGHGVVRDTLVRDGDRWRISRRIYDQFSIWPAMGGDGDALAKAARQVR